MQKRGYNITDSDLIWESFTRRKSNKDLKMDILLKEDYRYIEEFLIAEGLMDKVKGAWGSVKNFAGEKLIQPIINLIVQTISKDPTLAQKLQQAAADGPEAIQQLVSTHGDQSAVQQLQQPAMGESYSRQIELNDIIVEALISEGIMDYNHSLVIQERYFNSICQNILTEVKQKPSDCPWMPAGAIPIEENASAVKQIVDVISNARSSDPHFRPGRMFDMLQKKYPAFAKYVQTKGQAEAADSAQGTTADSAQGSTMEKPGPGQMALTHGGQRNIINKPKPAPEQPAEPASGNPEEIEQSPVQSGDYTPPEEVVDDTRGSGSVSTPAGQNNKPDATGSYAPPENYPGTNNAPTAQAPQGGGLLNKLWGFAKNNKGIMTGAVALGVLGALTMVPGAQPIAMAALPTALKAAGVGAGIGAFKTKGGIKDKIMGGLNAAGYASALGGAAGAIGGIGAGTAGAGAETATPTAEPVGGTVADGGMNADGTSTADISDADVESQYTDAMLDGDDGALADGSISDAEATEINAGLDSNQPTSPNDATASAEPTQSSGPPTPETDGSTNYTELQEPTRPGEVPSTSEYDTEADMRQAHDKLDTDGNGRLDDDEMPDLKTFGNAMDGPGDTELQDPAAPPAAAEADHDTTDDASQEDTRRPELTPGTPEYKELMAKMKYAHSQLDTDGSGVISDLERGPDTDAFMKKYSELMGQWPGNR